MARWAEYFEQLFKVNPPSRQFQTTGLQVMDADPSINEAASSIDEVKEGGGEAMIRGLHVVLTDAWHSSTILLDWVGRPYLERLRGLSALQQLPWDNAAQCTRLGVHPSTTDANSQ